MKRIAVAAALLLPAGALAFVMAGPTIVRRVAAHREELGLTSLVLRGTFTFRGADATAAAAALKLPGSSEVTAPGTVVYKMPGRCKIELESRNGPGPSATFVNGRVRATAAIPGVKGFAESVCPLLANPSGEELLSLLRERGVDLSQATLGRLGGVVAYVIGGRLKDATIPSFAVEKDRLDPLRLLSKDGEEVRLTDYSSPLAGEWHPRQVEIRRGEDLTRFVVEKIESNVKVPEL